jgi:hypothetical protein
MSSVIEALDQTVDLTEAERLTDSVLIWDRLHPRVALAEHELDSWAGRVVLRQPCLPLPSSTNIERDESRGHDKCSLEASMRERSASDPATKSWLFNFAPHDVIDDGSDTFGGEHTGLCQLDVLEPADRGLNHPGFVGEQLV